MKKMLVTLLMMVAAFSALQAASYQIVVKVPAGSAVSADSIAAAAEADSLVCTLKNDTTPCTFLVAVTATPADTAKAKALKAKYPAIEWELVTVPE